MNDAGDSRPWAADGSNVILYLTSVDPVHLNIGSVLCRPSDIISLANVFTARIIIFDIEIPITAGTSVSNIAILTMSLTQQLEGRAVSLFPRCFSVNLQTHFDARSGYWYRCQERSSVCLFSLQWSTHSNTYEFANSVLAKNTSAEVQITLRSVTLSGPSARVQPIPLEPFAVNKDMGRILIRRGGETIGAGRYIFFVERQRVLNIS